METCSRTHYRNYGNWMNPVNKYVSKYDYTEKSERNYLQRYLREGERVMIRIGLTKLLLSSLLLPRNKTYYYFIWSSARNDINK